MIPRSGRRAGAAALTVIASVGLMACQAGSHGAASSQEPVEASSLVAPEPTRASEDPEPYDCAGQALANLSLPAKVGQLVMLGFDAAGGGKAAARAVRKHQVGSVTMIGRSYAGVASIRRTSDRLQAAASVPLFVGTDQEGGQVQVLHGPGFPEMPSAKQQGRIGPPALEERAHGWGRALARAGVNLNLAPVLDVVPASLGSANAPIGRYDRAYGSTAATVTTRGLAVAAGYERAGVTPVAKHFPGLGAVRANPDLTAGVTDSSTREGSPGLVPFEAAIDAGVPVIMVSSATYKRLDPDSPALFSYRVVTDLLRDELGFRGVVISDDVGAAASVTAAAPIAKRGIRFIEAGGNLVLTVQITDVPVITHALIERASNDDAFAELVEKSAERVLGAKATAGVLDCPVD